VEPELTMEKVDGKWTVTVHREFTPTLRISSTCKNMLNGNANGKDVREFLREHIRKGRFFISCLEQRRETIRKVAQEIMARQEAFFEHGPAHLKPMTMAEVAQIIGVHETTISRTVGGKFAQTPHGVFELRSFFTSGMATIPERLSAAGLWKRHSRKSSPLKTAVSPSVTPKSRSACRNAASAFSGAPSSNTATGSEFSPAPCDAGIVDAQPLDFQEVNRPPGKCRWLQRAGECAPF
jgi:DNA-directed RNA polymerase specialized sigma54-like protein